MSRFTRSDRHRSLGRLAASLVVLLSGMALALGCRPAFAATDKPVPPQTFSSYRGWDIDPPVGAGPTPSSGDPQRELGASELPYRGWQASEPAAAASASSPRLRRPRLPAAAR